jgi:hypothetical protein
MAGSRVALPAVGRMEVCVVAVMVVSLARHVLLQKTTW